jgi:hypothetical protein
MGTLSSRLVCGLATVAAVGLASCATPPSRDSLLRELKSGLASARALPLGSRPTPPDLDLRSLKGISKSQLLQELGNPTYCGVDGDDPCATSSPWMYEWGPTAPPPKSGDGFVEVTAGGPFVVALDFASDTVSSARWQGQR